LALERGLLLEQSGRAAEALVEYEAALTKAPKDLDLMLRVGCGRVGAQAGKQAEEILNEVLQKRPRSSEALHCLGRALFLEDRNLEALKRLQQAVEIDPNRAEYHMYLGWVANEAGQVATAKAALTAALELDQGLGDAYWQRGVLNLRQGGPADAILDFKKALELTPGRFEAYADLAQAESQLNRTREALQHWSQAVAANGNNPIWLFRYGKLLSGQHQNAEAALRLEKALTLAEKEPTLPQWAWEAHRLAAISLGDSERALAHWKRFLELSPPDSPYRTDAKRALQRAGVN
jgi:tetratricopeptide (TPR) repeat protein